MKTFRYWQPVQIGSPDGEWADARYLCTYDDKFSELAHTVMDSEGCEVDVADDAIRPVPSLEVLGDDLRLTAEALAHYAHERVRLDMERNGGLTDDTLAVQRLHERAKAAIEVAR